MKSNWNSKTEYKNYSAFLANTDGKDFERKCLPLLRIIYPNAINTPSLLSLDNSGIDIVTWDERRPFKLVMQCKGFKVTEEEIGDSQIDQCIKSIKKFMQSKIQADTYILLHNRDGRYGKFNALINTELDKLVNEGYVKKAELWNRQQFLNHVFNHVLKISIKYFVDRKNYKNEFLDELITDIIHKVPALKSTLKINQFQLESQIHESIKIFNILDELQEDDLGNITILIGEAGFGKTTTVLQMLDVEKPIIYYPASHISLTTIGTKDLLSHFIDINTLFSDKEDNDIEVLRTILRPILEYLFRNQELETVIIIDGLDESFYFSQRGGLQKFFNQLRDINVSIILTARTEYWNNKIEDFKSSFGILSELKHRQTQTVKLIELQPWDNDTILKFSESYLSRADNNLTKNKINKFIELVKNNNYEYFYGDIPKRPLFLKMILETLSFNDKRTSKSQLLFNWVKLKIKRDYERPLKYGHQGREYISNKYEKLDDLIEISFDFMKKAAEMMTVIENNKLLLLPHCEFSDVIIKYNFNLRLENPKGIFLNSLLIPLPRLGIKQNLLIKFAHRIYQEFFLSLYIYENSENLIDIEIPNYINNMITDIKINLDK
jgi:GTPase SAR1 family protein